MGPGTPNKGKTSPKTILARERALQALQLRKAGASFAQIAERLGYRHEKSAWMAVSKEVDRITAEPAEAVRKLELARLDEMLMRLLPTVLKPPDELSMAERLPIVDRVLKIMDRRARLLGLDAPSKTEVTGPHGGAIEIAPARERLAALLELQYKNLQAENVLPAQLIPGSGDDRDDD